MRMSLRSLMFAAFWLLAGMILGNAFELGQSNPYVLPALGFLAGLLAVFMPSKIQPNDTREPAKG